MGGDEACLLTFFCEGAVARLFAHQRHLHGTYTWPRKKDRAVRCLCLYVLGDDRCVGCLLLDAVRPAWSTSRLVRHRTATTPPLPLELHHGHPHALTDLKI